MALWLRAHYSNHNIALWMRTHYSDGSILFWWGAYYSDESTLFWWGNTIVSVILQYSDDITIVDAII